MNEKVIDFFWGIAAINPLLARMVAGYGFWRSHSYLNTTGWYNSFRRKVPVDQLGNPIPWYSYPAIHFLESRPLQGLKVFEFGCGNSTLWWSSYAKHVVSCEHNREWYKRVKNNLPENVDCHLVEDDAYARFLSGFKKEFDVVVIDGIHRVDCALNCLGALKDEGVVIWDDSHRSDYQEGLDYLGEKGFKRVDFAGLGPIVMIPGVTTIFYRSNNCMGL